jgi:diguanylate cyclase (GGDEF)-like protein
MTISIHRIAGISATFVLLAVLCSTGAAVLFYHSLESGARQQRAESSARLLQTQIESQIGHYQDGARQLAAQAARTGLLNEGKAADRATIASLYSVSQPYVLKLRLLPAGARRVDTGSVPELSYACLDLLDRRQKGQSIPDAELHLFNTPSAHIDISALVVDPANNKHVLGHVLLSIDPAALRATLAALKHGDGYAELQQVTPDGEGLLVASGGAAALKQGKAPVLLKITNTNWQLAHWPGMAGGNPTPRKLALPGIAMLLALVLLGLSVALPRRWLARALKQDSESLSALFNDIRTGVLMGQYPFQFREFNDLSEKLRNTGEEMIRDRQELAKKAQSDSLTGLVSRAAFKTKLEQLHQQARGGLASVLLVADIDNLDAIKSEHGPDAGNSLLKQFAHQLHETLRQTDTVARIRNGKFAVLFPFTDLEKIEPIVERLRNRLVGEFQPGSGLPRTFLWSAGLTQLHLTDNSADSALIRAESALKQARKAGGNRTITQAAPTTARALREIPSDK